MGLFGKILGKKDDEPDPFASYPDQTHSPDPMLRPAEPYGQSFPDMGDPGPDPFAAQDSGTIPDPFAEAPAPGFAPTSSFPTESRPRDSFGSINPMSGSFAPESSARQHIEEYESRDSRRDTELILAKLDAIKAELDSLHQRVRKIESTTERSTGPRKITW